MRLAVFAAMMLLTACSDDDNTAEPLKLSGVTTLADMNTTIAEASMGSFIAVHGEGLDKANIDSVRINDIKIDLDEIYTENNVMYMKIPVKLAENVTDRMYIYNSLGCQELPLHVIAPDLKVERMFNEYTAPGDTIKIYGQYFNLYEVDSINGYVNFDGQKTKIISCSDTHLTTQVPANVKKNIKVSVGSTKFGVEAVCPGRYYDSECMLMDFDELKPNSMTNVVTDEKDKQRLSGNFLRIDQNSAWTGWWYIAEIGGTKVTDDMLDHPENYVVKCEFRTGNQFIDNKIRFCTYVFWAADPMIWSASDFNVQNFNQWETITLPWVVNRSETYPENHRYHSFNIRIETEESYARNFAFDNFRVCRKDGK